LKSSFRLLLIATIWSFLSIYSQKLFAQFYDQIVPGSSIKFKMVSIPAGVFTMGSAAFEKGRDDDEGPQKKIELNAFWMAEHEVTFAEWDAFFKNMDVPQTKAIAVDAVSRPTAQYIDLTWGMGRDPKHPTNSMSQAAGIMYCKWLYNTTGVFYRLPTEAEWEYACRAGKASDPENLKEYAYYKDNSASKYHKVAQLKPNAWGLYDMLGNVSEWTLDHYNENYLKNLADNANNPMAPASTAKYPKTLRGGGYSDKASDLRVAARLPSDPMWNRRDPQIPRSKWWITDAPFTGFRIIRPLQQPTTEEANNFYKQYLGK